MPFDNHLSQGQGQYQWYQWNNARHRRQDQAQQQQQNQGQIRNYFGNDLNLQNHGFNHARQIEDNPHRRQTGIVQYNLEPQLAPTWLSGGALPRQNPDVGADMERCHVCASRGLCMCRAAGGPRPALSGQNMLPQTWPGAGIGSSRQFEEGGLQWGIGRGQATELNLNLAAAHARGKAPEQPYQQIQQIQQRDFGQHSGASAPPRGIGGGFSPDYSQSLDCNLEQDVDIEDLENWAEIRKRCMVVTHPNFPELVARHIELLRATTPVDQQHEIDAQLAQAPRVFEWYRRMSERIGDVTQEEQEELDEFMRTHPEALGSFNGTLRTHMYRDVTQAMLSCWDMEQELVRITGMGLEPGSGGLMSDDDEDYDSDYGSYDQGMDLVDAVGFGPMVPTETERSLMERVRTELKEELQQGYMSKIEDVREEILRKRRAGKLPEGTTDVLKAWWQAHAKWPYPTEDEKEVLIQETGLELKQINNWFINQRKRNWHNNPLANNGNSAQASSSSKNKARKSW